MNEAPHKRITEVQALIERIQSMPVQEWSEDDQQAMRRVAAASLNQQERERRENSARAVE